MKKVVAVFLSIAMLTVAFPEYKAFAEENMTEIFVAPDGNDSAKGSIDAPLATLDGARKRVAELKSDGKPINVYIRGGEYKHTKTTEFSKADSGTQDAPITYMAYADEEPIFTGAVKIETEDFKGVTGEMYSRLPAESRDHVGVVDLKRKGITNLTKYTAETSGWNINSIKDVYARFYFNERPMVLAKWPNGSDQYARITNLVSNTEFGGDTKGRMKNWVTADNPIMRGMIRVAWGVIEVPVTKFDVNKETMSFAEGTMGDTPAINGQWTITNLIEELDVPGEYYLDYDDLKLYFYPPYSTVGVDMHLAVSENELLKMDGTKYVTFKGLTFEKTRQTAISLQGTDNIKFLDCTIQQTSWKGIAMTDNCHNTLIDGCDFRFSGQDAVKINDSDYMTVNVNDDDNVNLTKQNNVVNNCSFWAFNNQFTYGSSAIALNGIGNSITNCKFHEAACSAIYFKGNDHTINNNEFYNMLKYMRDQGVVYNGRNLYQRGVQIAYNHFHDIQTFDTGSAAEGYARVIYADDCLGGLDINHNLIVNTDQPTNLGGGTDTWVNYNIIAKNNQAGNLGSQGYTPSQFKTAYSDLRHWNLPYLYSLEAWKKYPNMHRVFWGDTWPVYGVQFVGNLFFQNQIEQYTLGSGAEAEGASNDEQLYYNDEEYLKMFNDPDNGDYTIREDYVLPEGFEELKNIKLENIGIYKSEYRDDDMEELSGFKLYYPYNFTESVSGQDAYLSWEWAMNADSFIVEVALDENFENIVGTYTAPGNYIHIDDLDNDLTEYYWRVYAVSNNQNAKATRLNDGGARKFRTKAYDIVDTKPLEDALAEAEKILENITEGIEPGNIAYGATDNLNVLIEDAKAMLNSGKGLQTDYDTLVNLLNKEKDELGKTVVRRYSDIEKVLGSQDSWVCTTKGDGLTKTDNGIILNNQGKEMAVYTSTEAPVEQNVIYCFNLNMYIPEFAEGGTWEAIAFQSINTAGNYIWNSGRGYLFLVKGSTIEVQLYDGNSGSIITTIPNTLKMGSDSEVKFGVLDFNAGQRIILEIDGDVVFDHVEYEKILRDDLYLTLYDCTKTGFSYDPKEIEIKSIGEENLPDNRIMLGTKDSEGENDISAAIKSMSGNDEITIQNGFKGSAEKTDTLKSITFSIKPQLNNMDQGIYFRASDSIIDEDTSNYYMLSFKSGKLVLTKNNHGVKQTLSVVKTDAVKSNEYNRIKINTMYENGGMRIIVYLDEKELMNVQDSQLIDKAGYFGIFNKSGNALSVKG